MEKHDNNDEIDEVEHHICHQCHRQFKTHRGLMQHQRTCKVTLNILSNNEMEITRTGSLQKAGNNKNIMVIAEDYTTTGTTENIHEQFYWAEYKGNEITKIINEVYEKIVFW